LQVNGGQITIVESYEELESAAITVNDGQIHVAASDDALDYDRSFTLSGGLLVAAGMAQVPDESSTQYSVLLNLESALRAGTLVHIRNSEGLELLTFAPANDYQSIAFSSAELDSRVTYEVYYGGSASGTAVDGLHQDGTHSAGSLAGSFSLTGIVTRLGRTSGVRGAASRVQPRRQVLKTDGHRLSAGNDDTVAQRLQPAAFPVIGGVHVVNTAPRLRVDLLFALHRLGGGMCHEPRRSFHMQHCLYLLPLPQGQGALRGTRSLRGENAKPKSSPRYNSCCISP
jgi:hypothetical protein